MATDITRRLERTFRDPNEKEALYILGGVALIAFGAGLLLSSPNVRRALGQTGIGSSIGNFVSSALPDLERYLRIH